MSNLFPWIEGIRPRVRNLSIAIAVAGLSTFSPVIPAVAQEKPNILIIWGDDIGQSNISAYTTSNTFYDWMLDRVYLMLPAQDYVGNFLKTFKEFPPRQKAASFTVDQVMEKLQQNLGSN